MGSLNMRHRLAAAIVGLSLAMADPALACGGRTVIFEDNFQDASGGWEVDPNMSFGKSGMGYKWTSEYTSGVSLNNAFVIKDADICLEAAWPAGVTDEVFGFGIMFWAVDYQNHFLYLLDQGGFAALHRRIANQWGKIVQENTPAIKKDPGATNLMRITLKGGMTSMYVNGTKFKDQRVQAPTSDMRFGVRAQRVKTGTERTFHFNSIKVTTVD